MTAMPLGTLISVARKSVLDIKCVSFFNNDKAIIAHVRGICQPLVFFHLKCYRGCIVLSKDNVTERTMSSQEKMTVDERRKYLRQMKKRYQPANRQERGQLLAEMEQDDGTAS